MSSTPLSYQDLLILSQELANTDNPQTREHLIAQLISTIEQRIAAWLSIDKFFIENAQAQEFALALLEQNAAYIPIDEIIRMFFLGNPDVNKTLQKLITIRKSEIPAEPFLEKLNYTDYDARHNAIEGLKALGEYAPREILIATVNDSNHLIASIAVEALVLLQEPPLLAPLLENFMAFNWWIQLHILQTMNQINICVPLELLNYALNHRAIEMRKAALGGLAKHRKDAPIQAIENAVQDESIGLEAMLALDEIKDYKNPLIFLEILRNPQKMSEMRVEAARILLHKGLNVPIQILLTLLFHNDTSLEQQHQIHAMFSELGESSVEEVLSYAHEETIISAQIAALQILSVMDEPSLPAKLREIVSNKQLPERLRQTSMRMIGENKEHSAANVLWSILENDEDHRIKEDAHNTLRALGQIDEYEIYTPFGSSHFSPFNFQQQDAEYLQNGLAPMIKLITTMQAEQQTPQEIAQVIANKLLEDFSIEELKDFFPVSEPKERFEYPSINRAISTLSRASDERARTVLKVLLAHNDPMIRTSCIFTLLQSHPEIVLAHLTDQLNAKDEPPNAEEITALARFQESLQMQSTSQQEERAKKKEIQQAVAAILEKTEGSSFPEIVFNKSNVEVRRSVMQSLQRADASTHIDTILIALRDDDMYIRINALTAATKLGLNMPLEPLIAALDDPEYDVRATAMEALSIQKERVPIEIFLKGLSMEYEGKLPDTTERYFSLPVPVIAAQALGDLHEQRAIEPLLALLEHKEDEIRAAVMEALGKLSEHLPLAPFLDALHDGNCLIRISACQALESRGKSGRTLPTELLLAALGDSDSDTTYAYEDPRYYPYDYGRVRQAAAHALMSIQPQILLDLVPELYATLDGQMLSRLFDALVASQTVDIIREIGYVSPVFLKLLRKFLDHSYWEVRMKAKQAIDVL